MVDPNDAPTKPVETFVKLAPSLKDLGNDNWATKKAGVDLRQIREQHEKEKRGDRCVLFADITDNCSAARQVEIQRMQDDLRILKKRAGDASDSGSDSETRRKKRRAGTSYLGQELSKYTAGRGRSSARAGNKRGKREEEDDLLKEMGKFSKKVALADEEEEADQGGATDIEEAVAGEGMELDDDVGWMRHRLKFVVDEKELTRRAEDEYSVIDPRAKARSLAEEQKKEKENQRRGRTAADVGRVRR